MSNAPELATCARSSFSPLRRSGKEPGVSLLPSRHGTSKLPLAQEEKRNAENETKFSNANAIACCCRAADLSQAQPNKQEDEQNNKSAVGVAAPSRGRATIYDEPPSRGRFQDGAARL